MSIERAMDGWVLISSHSASSSALGLARILGETAILPMSWKYAALRRHATLSSESPSSCPSAAA